VKRSDTQRKRRLWLKWLLAAASTLAALLGVEAAYRVKLKATVGDVPLGMSATYRAANVAAVKFDADLGYRYRPNTDLVVARITDGKPVLLFEQPINAEGNVGPPATDYAAADLKLMVVGDSFTAIVHDGEAWPDRLARELEKRRGETVRQVNLARDGYGVLQMFDLAAARVDDLSPDVVMICFIADDLTRARVWRGAAVVDGRQRTWVSTTADPDPAPERRVDGELIDARVSRQWFENWEGKASDPLLADLNGEFQRLLAERATAINFFDASRSFVYSRLVWGDPFFGMHNTTFNPRIREYSYASDDRLPSAISKIRRAGARLALVQLPQYEDLLAGRHPLSGQQTALRKSLEEIAGCPTRELLTFGKPPEPVEELFLLPHDRHPSAEGPDYFAEAAAKMIESELPAN